VSFFDGGPEREIGLGRLNFSLEPMFGVHAFIVKRAAATANLTLTTSNQDIVGATLTLDTPGVYVVLGVFDFDGTTGDGTGVGELDVDGVVEGGVALAALPNTIRVTVPQNWLVTKTTLGPTVLKLQARKTGGTGASLVRHSHTTIMAFTVPGSQDLTALT